VRAKNPHWRALGEALNPPARDASGRITALILTYCRKPELFYGTSMIFETLRVGFPRARVVVADNASTPSLRPEIEALARSRDCAFVQIPDPAIQHHDFLELALRETARGRLGGSPLVFLDPDLCFWRSCEGFRFDGLMAGRLFGAFQCEVTDSLTMPRLHTSFLWIPEPAALWAEIERIRAAHFDFEPFQCFSTRIAGRWCRFDTGASLYAAVSDRVSCFEEEHLDRYDHLFHGSHPDLVLDRLKPELKELRGTLHDRVKAGDLTALRGTWREQKVLPRTVPAGAVAIETRGQGRKPPRAVDGRTR
jgi:hypothetical protein